MGVGGWRRPLGDNCGVNRAHLRPLHQGSPGAKDQPCRSASDPHPPMWNRDPLDTPGVSGVSGPWDPGSVLMGRFWAIEGLQAKRCNNVLGEEKPNPCVSMSVSTEWEGKAPRGECGIGRGEIKKRRPSPEERTTREAEGKTDNQGAKGEEGWPL